MSVIIKDMDMPIDCLACRIACDKENFGVIGRPPKCPLTEAPDGDLIGRAETIEAVELMEIFLGERKKNAVIRGIQALPSAELVLQTPQTYGKSINPSNAEVVEDYISRADAIEAVRMSEHRITIADEQGGVGTVKWDMWGVYTAEAVEAIKALPSADAVQGWIPCNERLPSKSGDYLCTIPLYADETYTQVLTFHRGRFYEDDDVWGATYRDDVIAWMPLPKPWKGADDED